MLEDVIYQTVLFGFGGCHEVIAFGILGDGVHLLAGVLGEDGVDHVAGALDFFRLDEDVCCLALGAAEGLVDHHTGIGEGITLAGCAACEQQSAHAGGLADDDGADRALDVLHGIVDGHARSDHAARGVDVEVDVGFGVFGFQKQQLGDDEVGDVVLDLSCEEEDALLEEAAVDIVGAFAAGGLLDYHRDKVGHGEFQFFSVFVFSVRCECADDTGTCGCRQAVLCGREPCFNF